MKKGLVFWPQKWRFWPQKELDRAQTWYVASVCMEKVNPTPKVRNFEKMCKLELRKGSKKGAIEHPKSPKMCSFERKTGQIVLKFGMYATIDA